MHIPRPAKLLFQHDDGWERFLEKNGHQLTDWTKLSVERMLACGTCAMGVKKYCCSAADCPHSRLICQTCKTKACSSCGLKATEQWISEQQHILPDCDWCQYRLNSDPPCQSKTDPPPLSYSGTATLVFFWS